MEHLAVISLHFGGPAYLKVSRDINQRYCMRHGLRFAVHAPRDTPGRHPIWWKVRAVAEELDRAEHVLYLDGDAVFANHDRRPDFLLERLGERSILLGPDFRPDHANTGVFLVRRSDAAFAILEEWWGSPRFDPTLGQRWPLEEAGFNERVLQPNREEVVFEPDLRVELLGGRFVKHFASVDERGKHSALVRERGRLARLHGWNNRLERHP